MALKQQLEFLSQQLASFDDEQVDRFDETLHTICVAHELALNHHAADAIDIARRVTGPLSPSEGRAILAAMIQALPNDPKSLLNISDVCELLSVSPATVAEWIETGQLRASNLSKSNRPRWVIRGADFDRFLEFRAAR
jgi:Helix-turn-helix domain